MSAPALILASSSSSRRTILAVAGVKFTTAVPDVDEDDVRASLTPEKRNEGSAVAGFLAECKALAVSERYPDALVIGCDQVLTCGGMLFNKAADLAQARAALRALRGREHQLISAVLIAKGASVIWRHTEIARLVMRDFSDAFLEEYLHAEIPDVLGSVGCYRIEGRGAQLFSKVEGDHFTIRGLPLFALLEALREQGVLPS